MREKPSAEISPELIEADIESLLETLDAFDFESLAPQMQEEWYYIEMQARVGKDRTAARENLEAFIHILTGLTKVEAR